MSLKKQNWVPAKHFSAAILRLIFFDLFAAHSPPARLAASNVKSTTIDLLGKIPAKMARWLFSYRSQQSHADYFDAQSVIVRPDQGWVYSSPIYRENHNTLFSQYRKNISIASQYRHIDEISLKLF